MDVGGLSLPSLFTLTLPIGQEYDHLPGVIGRNDYGVFFWRIPKAGIWSFAISGTWTEATWISLLRRDSYPYRPHRCHLRESGAMEYTVAFNIASAGYKTWAFGAFGLPFVLIGALMLKFHKYLPGWPVKSVRFKKGVAISCLGFSIVWTSVAFFTTYSQYRSLITALETGSYKTAEGVVKDFVPMDYSGHSYESFTVDGTAFQYSDYDVTAGFNQTQSHGGPMREGLKVRITHVDNVIIKLEVAAQ